MRTIETHVDHEDPRAAAELDRAVVRVMYLVARAMDHDATFVAAVDRVLDRNRVDDQAHLVCLLRI